MKKHIVYLQMRGVGRCHKNNYKEKNHQAFKNGFIGGLLGGTIFVAGGWNYGRNKSSKPSNNMLHNPHKHK